MKKRFFIPTAVILLLTGILIFGELSAAREEGQSTEGIIRLHVRAADDSEEEQALKLKVRDRILTETQTLLEGCDNPNEAKKILAANLSRLQEVGSAAVRAENKNHTVEVLLTREFFEYREYDGFFLPEGEYESLLVNIGTGEGKNWWCVVFPAACYMGKAEMPETDPTLLPACFRIAKVRPQEVEVKWGVWEWIKSLFD